MHRGARVTSALAIAAIGALVVASCAAPNRDAKSTPDAGFTEDEPRGTLLVGIESIDQETMVLDLETGDVQALPDGLVAWQLSADGSAMLASPLLHEPSGLGYAIELVSVDVRTGATDVLVRAEPQGGFEHASWSPDGSRIAYTLYADRHETASSISQDQMPQYTLCVRTLQSGETRCFAEVGSVYSFDWSPDGERLLSRTPGDEPIQVIDVATGQTSMVVSAEDLGVLDVMRKQAGAAVHAVGFIEPSWSPSGRYIGAIAVADGRFVPMILSSEGALVAWGRSNPEFRPFGWSPTSDVLAYAVGVNGESSPEPAVHLLDPVSGEDGVLLPSDGESAPMVFDLEWSPGGRWLALRDMSVVRLIDTTGVKESRRIHPFRGLPGAVIDWIA
jgi:WD40-like Beta Propeller Repeat